MKMGFRTPSPGRSLKASTSGRLTRAAKGVNPVYGAKGMGVVNNPKRAAYNAVYSRATVGVNDISASDTPPDAPTDPPDIPPTDHMPSDPQGPKRPIYKKWWFWVIAILFTIGVGTTANQKKETPVEVVEATPEPTKAPEPTPTPEPEPEKKVMEEMEPAAETPPPEKKKKKKKKKGITVYVAASGSGSCYHTDPYCSGMNGDVIKMKLKKAKQNYRPCSRCGGGGFY